MTYLGSFRRVAGLVGMVTLAAGAGVSCRGSSEGGDGGFSACGGDVTGTWQVQSVDFRDDLFDGIDDGLPDACSGGFRGATATGNDASMTFEAGVATAEGSLVVSVEFRYGSRCIEALSEGALTQATTELCEGMGAALDESAKEDDPSNSGSCRLVSGGCDCTMKMTEDISSVDSYSQEGSTLIIEESEVDYCVSGNELTLQDEESTIKLSR